MTTLPLIESLQGLAELGQRAVGHREHEDVAECRSFAWRAGAGIRADVGGQSLVILEVARREHDLMPGARPHPAERTAHIARADHPDLHRL